MTCRRCICITYVGCLAHARRKFDEAIEALGKTHEAKGGRATKGLGYVQKPYRIERAVKDSLTRGPSDRDRAMPNSA